MDIAACPRCASLDMRVPTIQDGLWPGGGETSFLVCADCAYRGAPLLFATESEYLAFRQNVPPAPLDPEAPAPEAPQRAMPVFIAMVALLVVAAAVAGGVATAADPDAGGWGRLAAVFGVSVGLMFGAAFLRIAYRAWRPGAV